MDVTYVPSREGSIRKGSPQDTPPSSAISICKEQPSDGPCYAVQRYDDKDDAGYVPTWKHRLNKLLPLTSFCAISAYWLYFSFRVVYTVAAQNLKHTVYPVAWLFLSIELGVACEPPDIPRSHFRGCLLMRISHSTSTAHSIVAMYLDQASPPPKTACHWRLCS